MGRRLARTDQSTRVTLILRVCMDDEKMDHANHTNRLPAVTIRMAINPAQCQRIVENKPRRFKTQTMLLLIEFILVIAPYPLHGNPAFSVTTIL